MYLIYHITTRQVVEIQENEPQLDEGYDYVISNKHEIGDEFEYTIWVNGADEDKNLTSYSTVRNNPNAKRLLEQNEELKNRLELAENIILDLIILGGN